MDDLAQLEQAIYKATRNDDDCLQELIQEAIEKMDGKRANRVLDTVLQIMREDVRDLYNWNNMEATNGTVMWPSCEEEYPDAS